jgi:putative ABC transport system ATP-binding protein
MPDISVSPSETLKVRPQREPAGSGHDVVISLRDIRRIYDLGEVRVEALKGISLDILRGQFVAIMGTSGSGKSTMLNILGCLDRPTSGTYHLDGIDVSTFSPAERADIRNQKIGFIFQSFNLLPRTSVWENIEAPMLYSSVPKAERALRIEAAMKVVGIPEKAKALPNQLSGGQQQRVAVARALVNRPAILLADEPTGNLDSTTSEEIMRFLQNLNREKGITLLMVTHEHDIAAYATRVIHMKDGHLTGDEMNPPMAG